MTAADAMSASTPEQELPKMSFLDHLEELRKRIIFSFVAVIVAFLACWNWAEKIFGWLQSPIAPYLHGDHLAYTRLTAPFFLYMKVAFYAGIFVASPFILWQVWLFIAPGLYPRERRWAVPFVLFATLFFLLGGAFGFRVILPITCKFFVDTGAQFKAVITIDDYFSFASMIVLSCGLIFEMPMLIFFLARLGIVTPKFLMKQFRWAVVGSFIIAAVITPTPDMVTQTLLALPMIGLYLVGVAVAYFFGRKPARA